MPVEIATPADIAKLGFDAIIDVRSPAEFAEDHVPGAISLPVLDDEERARVGTIYVQQSPFLARKIGAALVARNAARHIEERLMDHDGGWRPLVYCWRGGQRSGSFAVILKQIGWRAETVAGGYQAYRRAVVRQLYEMPFPAPLVLLDGNTGTAKTDVLKRLGSRGVQVVDLEGLANHRGSVFGNMGPQPAQKAFETRLAAALGALDPARPVVMEAESSRIGECNLPPRIFEAMKAAPRVVIEAPLAARAAYLARAYGDLVADREALVRVIGSLRQLQGAETVEGWAALAEAGAFEALAGELMERHYDPRYAKSRGRQGPVEIGTVRGVNLSEADLDRLAGEIEGIVSAPR